MKISHFPTPPPLKVSPPLQVPPGATRPLCPFSSVRRFTTQRGEFSDTCLCHHSHAELHFIYLPPNREAHLQICHRKKYIVRSIPTAYSPILKPAYLFRYSRDKELHSQIPTVPPHNIVASDA